MKDTTKLDGLRPGDRYEGVTVLFCNATRGNCGNSPYSHHSKFSHKLEQ